MADIAGTGAHLTENELRAWTSFLDAGRILETELARHLSAQFEMTHREYEVLVRLDGHGGVLRMSILGRQIEASSPLVTQTVARLEEKGWVTRTPTGGDRRGVDATLTHTGRAALAQASGPHATLIRELLLHDLGEDLPVVAAALSRIAEHLRAHRAGDSCGLAGCRMANDGGGED